MNTKSFFSSPSAAKLEWVTVGNLDSHPKGSEVIAALQRLEERFSDEDGGLMQVAVENTSGELLLVARVPGMHGWLGLVHTLKGLGLTDRLEESFFHGEPFDAAFS